MCAGVISRAFFSRWMSTGPDGIDLFEKGTIKNETIAILHGGSADHVILIDATVAVAVAVIVIVVVIVAAVELHPHA